MPLKKQFLLVLLAGTLVSTAQASTVLPAACGDDKVTFDVTLDKDKHDPSPAPPDMAKVVLIQVTDIQGSRFMNFGTSDFTMRFGVDGAWMGAAGNNSYLAILVKPGDHHLCVAGQGTSTARKMISASSFTAEAGKVYYFQVKATRLGGTANFYNSDFTRLNEDEGKFHADALPVSVSKPKP
jgi:hypothetical protein